MKPPIVILSLVLKTSLDNNEKFKSFVRENMRVWIFRGTFIKILVQLQHQVWMIIRHYKEFNVGFCGQKRRIFVYSYEQYYVHIVMQNTDIMCTIPETRCIHFFLMDLASSLRLLEIRLGCKYFWRRGQITLHIIAWSVEELITIFIKNPNC